MGIIGETMATGNDDTLAAVTAQALSQHERIRDLEEAIECVLNRWDQIILNDRPMTDALATLRALWELRS